MNRLLRSSVFTAVFFASSFCVSTGFSQSIASYDKELTGLYRKILSDGKWSDVDSAAKTFEKELLKALSETVTFDQSFDSLKQYVTVSCSDDRKIKFYSWDDYTGGTWHVIHCVAQYRTGNGKICVRKVSTGGEMEFGGYTDASVYEVHEIVENGKTYYLTFAWGTHGAGMEHKVAQLFSINEDSITKEKAFFGEGELVMEYPRDYSAEFHFDQGKNELDYFRWNEVAHRDGSVFTAESIYWKEGKFIAL